MPRSALRRSKRVRLLHMYLLLVLSAKLLALTHKRLRQMGVARIGNSTVCGIGSSTSTLPRSEKPMQGKQVPVFHGSVFDPDTKGHVQKLKEMDPINFETVLLLMRNLSVNLTFPDFELIVIEEVPVII